jgi:hypothetical protein
MTVSFPLEFALSCRLDRGRGKVAGVRMDGVARGERGIGRGREIWIGRGRGIERGTEIEIESESGMGCGGGMGQGMGWLMIRKGLVGMIAGRGVKGWRVGRDQLTVR